MAELYKRRRPISHWHLVVGKDLVIDELLYVSYLGAGTRGDPYVVRWETYDSWNPLQYSAARKWSITIITGLATFVVAFCTSAYSSGGPGIKADFGVKDEEITLGLSLFILGFAIGPLVWAPLSELYGRQLLYAITFGALSLFNLGTIFAQNIETLITLRFLAGAFGVSIMTNSGGTVADLFHASERGFAMIILSFPAFMGPVIGPVVGGFVSQMVGWRWLQGVQAICTGIMWIAFLIFVPETYGPVILRQRARRLTKAFGKAFSSVVDAEDESKSLRASLKQALTRPWMLLFREPIVLLLSIYLAIIYGTLYLTFEAFPIVYQKSKYSILHNWSKLRCIKQGVDGTKALVALLSSESLLA